MLKVFNKISFKAVFWIFFYFFIFCLLLRNGFSYLDPDFGWHLQVGKEIAISAQVPSQNIYNYTYSGAWVDHEWLSNYLIFKIYDNFGYPALVAAFALLIVVVLILLNLTTTYLYRKKDEGEPFMSIVIFQLLGVIAAMPHFGVRIQEIALLFLFLILAIIYFYNKNRNWRYLLFFIPLFYIWSCLHASFLIGLFIIFSWAGVKLAERMIFNSKFKEKAEKYFDLKNALHYQEIINYILVSSLAFIVTLFTPYYLKLYSFLFGYSNTLYLSYIQEWFSQFSFPFFYWQLLYLGLAALALFIYIYNAKKKKLDLWSIFLFLLFFILSFKSRRHFPLFFIASFFSCSIFIMII